MNYLIIHENTAFYTNWYDVENNHVDGMLVVNLISHKYTTDGINWMHVEEDSL